MQITMPYIKLEEDTSEKYPNIMARSGYLVGFSKSRAVWRFGFTADSHAAQAYRVHTEQFTFVLSKHDGKEIARIRGFALDLPKRFLSVIDGGW